MNKAPKRPPARAPAVPPFRLGIKRLGRPPKPYAWAIYVGEGDAYVRLSAERFRFPSAAWDAGCKVIGRL
jgi:hypothetical protein